MSKDLRIVKIIDDTTLVGKGGKDAGIIKGTKYNVVGKSDGEDIIDPETHESLGFLGLKKAIVTATQVEEHFTVYKSQYVEEKKTYTGLLGMSSTLSSINSQKYLGTPEKVPAHYHHLDVDLNAITGTELSSTIEVGDYLEKA